MNKDGRTVNGMTLGGTLTVIFVVLKLVGVIHWSWLWVLAPMWLPIAIFVFVVALIWAVHKFK